MSEKIYDFVAVGLGPFNLSLACLTDPIKTLDGLFLEQRSSYNWHPGMMLEGVHLQTPFMSDLVTLADPTSPLSFLNYIKQQGRLYSFYIREDFFLMRSEYNQYCQWAAEQLSSVRFDHRVLNVSFDQQKQCYKLTVSHSEGRCVKEILARKLILGTGPSPYSPPCCPDDDPRFIHSSDYLYKKEYLQSQTKITVVGGGQSAAEIYYDLLQEIDSKQYELNWITRSPRFFPLEYSKLTLEMTSPEYVDYFYQLPTEKRDQLNAQQKNLYKGINSDLINEIYDLLYVKRLNSNFTSHILTNSELTDVREEHSGSMVLSFYQREQEKSYHLPSDAVVLGTGYQYCLPDFLQGISQCIHWDQQGRFDVKRNYSIDHNDSIFVQNAELHTHGFVTPDLGMACYRNSCIIRELLGFEYYPIEKRIAFQQFSAPDDLSLGQANNCAFYPSGQKPESVLSGDTDLSVSKKEPLLESDTRCA